MKKRIMEGLFLVVLGILLIIFKSKLVQVLITILGSLLIVLGVILAIKRKRYQFLLISLVGAVFILTGWLLLSLSICFIGFMVLLIGMDDFCKINQNIMNRNFYQRILTILLPISELALGLLLIIGALSGYDLLIVIIGGFMIFSGLLILLKNDKIEEVKVVETRKLD